MLKFSSLLALLSSVGLVACDGSKSGQQPIENPDPTPTASAEPLATGAPSAEPSAAATTVPTTPPAPPPPKPAVSFSGFATPESVLYDAPNDRYLVSNINGKPVDVDNNGFISELTPDGGVKTLKWIEGGQKKVTLNAPKGMAIDKGVLYVADLDAVRMFDAKTGAPKGEVKLEGATFANDVAAHNGKVYVSDSGLKMEGADFKPTGTDAVFVIEKGKAKPLAKGVELGKPNGLLGDGKQIWVTTFGSGEVYALDEKGQKSGAAKPPKGALDGIVLAGARVLVSSWEGSTVYEKKGDTFTPVLEQLSTPADVGWDSKRSRVLVPRFSSNTVEAYDLK